MEAVAAVAKPGSWDDSTVAQWPLLGRWSTITTMRIAFKAFQRWKRMYTHARPPIFLAGGVYIRSCACLLLYCLLDTPCTSWRTTVWRIEPLPVAMAERASYTVDQVIDELDEESDHFDGYLDT